MSTNCPIPVASGPVAFSRLEAARRQHGFTLLELLITVTVVAILTAVALPSYGTYVLRTARAEARANMLEASQFMERFYAVNNRYDQTLAGTAVTLPLSLSVSPRSGTARYNISLTAALTRGTYVLQAVPAGASATDECGTLTISSTGVRTASLKSTSDGVADCWR